MSIAASCEPAVVISRTQAGEARHCQASAPTSIGSPPMSSFVSAPPDSLRDASQHSWANGIVAIAIFDRSGILEGCEVCGTTPSQNWTDAAFHTIGLKKLLTTCLKQQNFEYAKVSAAGCTTFILRRRNRYVAIVAPPQPCTQEASLAKHLRELNLAELIGLVRSRQLVTVA